MEYQNLFLILFLFTLILIVHGRLDLDPSDHRALLALRKDLGFVSGLRHRGSDSTPCNFPGVFCQPGIISSSLSTQLNSTNPLSQISLYKLKITRIIFKSQRLKGFLSPAIGNLSELKELSLPNNHLSGQIPLQLLNCWNLEILNLQNNQFSGKVPSELPSLVSLRILDLSDNMFTGNLGFLQYFRNLEKLSVANNMFTGKIPAEALQSIPNLRSVNFSDNSFLERERTDVVNTDYIYSSAELIPKRYIFAENAIAPSDSTMNPAEAPSPVAVAAVPKHKKKRNPERWALVFVVGALAGFIGGTFLMVVFKLLSVVISGEGKNIGCVIFSQTIKSEDLAFLGKEDGLASLQVIGRGGCGEVYKAEIAGDRMIAIKKIAQPKMDAVALTEEDTKALNKKMRQVRAEVQIVGQIRHRNLLPLLAHVSQSDCHYLVYQFMKNGSLEGMLARDFEGTREEDWLARHKIALGIAVGLEYLHINHSPHIIHRDLKPANILLGDDMEARIADFGLSRVVPDAVTHITSSNVAGTLGYIAPEYHQTMKFTAKCDIYSFGVLLAVLVTGKLPSDVFFRAYQIGLVKWVRNVMISEDPRQVIDPRLLGNGFEEQMLLVLMIACYCTRDNPKDRPNSKDIRCMLAQIQH